MLDVLPIVEVWAQAREGRREGYKVHIRTPYLVKDLNTKCSELTNILIGWSISRHNESKCSDIIR
jgi:protein gp37